MMRIERRRSPWVVRRLQRAGMLQRIVVAMSVVFAAALMHPAAAARPDEPPVWLTQLGSSGYDYALALAVGEDGTIAICGRTDGSLGGAAVSGFDAWLARYDKAGQLSWTRQLGTTEHDDCRGVAMDAGGNILVTGSTQGLLAAGYNSGVAAWVAKYDPAGSLVWVLQQDTGDNNWSNGVAFDAAGNVFIGGGMYANGDDDAFVAAYGPDGSPRWLRTFSLPFSEQAQAIAVDGDGNVVISGSAQTPLAQAGGAFVAKYDGSGGFRWSRLLGSPAEDQSLAVATDADGNVVAAGWTEGRLTGVHRGGTDAWLAKYGKGGKLLWKRQLGTRAYDVANAVAADGEGNVFVVGGTTGALGGRSRRSQDPWLAKYAADGTLLWKLQFGSYNEDWATGVAVDGEGHILVGGSTWGRLPGPRQGRYDAFIAKFSDD